MDRGETRKMLEGHPGNIPEGKKLPQFMAAGAATLIALSGGCSLAWTSPALLILQAKDSWLPVSTEEGSLVGSILALGAIAGALPAGSIAEKFGRKPVLLSLSVPFILSFLLIAFANSVGMLYAARFIAGVATGASCVLAPMYISEIAENSVRGTLGSFFQLLITIGIFIVYCLGIAANYDVLSWVCFAMPIVFLAAFVWMPEAPKYLLSAGKRTEAEKSLSRLRGMDDVSAELSEIQRAVDEEANAKENTSIKDLFSSKTTLKALLICLGIMVFQQLSGVNAVIFYTGDIFKDAGSGLPTAISPVIVGAVQTVATGVAAALVDRAGRRILLLLSSSMMAVCLAALGAYFNIRGPGEEPSEASKSLGWLPLVSLTVFIIVFSLGFGPIPWALTGELFAPNVKGIASGVAVGINWTMAFVVTKIFPTLRTSIGSDYTFWMFALLNVASVTFVLFLVLETKGKSLQQIQKELETSGTAIKCCC
ncbi:hypothetical protein J437_LFUL007292 [Ladona fulva]|uniref:Major facilitator superfamily (MFS) profile domain-containing protein n=1 Tax=Ladona fulva TaxID=123851 RepID=A0A8K0K1K3_LADFU|nr:hypothetical protein J437_LFUL007292 [Ladona fulva]